MFIEVICLQKSKTMKVQSLVCVQTNQWEFKACQFHKDSFAHLCSDSLGYLYSRKSDLFKIFKHIFKFQMQKLYVYVDF